MRHVWPHQCPESLSAKLRAYELRRGPCSTPREQHRCTDCLVDMAPPASKCAACLEAEEQFCSERGPAVRFFWPDQRRSLFHSHRQYHGDSIDRPTP